MDINDLFESKYVSAHDLQGATPTVTIERVAVEEVGTRKDVKGVIYFVGKEKGVIINAGKKKVLVGLYGGETDHWIGQRVMLTKGTTMFEGEQKDCINFLAPPPAQQSTSPPPAKESFTAAEAEEIVASEVAGAATGNNVPF